MELKKHHTKIENGFKTIFNTAIESKSDYLGSGYNDLTTSIEAPLVKQQIIQLAKLCQDVPLNTILKASGGKIIIEFW